MVAVTAAVLCASWCGSALAAGDINTESCNEFAGTEGSPGFRRFLPDCRAYEMVSPPYEGGQSAFGVGRQPPPITTDGEHLLAVDFAGLAGTENEEQNGSEFGAIYEFSRTPSGWSTESLEPPASQYPRRLFVAGSADLSRSLWALAIPSQEGEEVGVPEEDGYDFAVRGVPIGGRAPFEVVGPEVSPEHEKTFPGGAAGAFGFAGASHDLSHILLSVKSQHKLLWPGDKTREGEGSLYEYIGTGNREPTLVGVTNPAPLEGKPYLNEGAELASECGTALGSLGDEAKDTAYNALSASGAVVYFTAQHVASCSGTQPSVNELYARISGSATVKVSEPAMSAEREKECSGVCREDENEENGHTRSAAVFEGASEDGSRVFFRTEQPLLNSDGDGKPDLYEAELEDGRITRLVQVSHDPTTGQSSEVVAVARISEDGSHVYYVAKGVLTTTPNGNEEMAEQDAYNLYVYDTRTGRTSFVANLATKAETEELSAVELVARTGVSPVDRRPFETTPTGRFLLFVNARHLTGSEDTSTVNQLFEYDAQQERLQRVSIGQCPPPRKTCLPSEGFNHNGNTTSAEAAPQIVATPHYSEGMIPTSAASHLSLVDSGAVMFSSRDSLTPQAVEGRENIYEYREGNVYLISPGDEAIAPKAVGLRLLGASESGSDIFFRTTDSLVPEDTDTQANWYDAREGGGFPAPVSQGGCLEEACHGPLAAAPMLPSSSGTAIQSPGDNFPSAVPGTVGKPKSKPVTRAEKLAMALNACKRRPKKQRPMCDAQARKKYGPGPTHKARKATGRGK